MKPARIRVVAVVLALSLAATFAPTAYAAGEVCQIGSELYMSLDDALLDVDDGDTIKLLADIDYAHGLTFVEIDITFDLNGYDLNVHNSSGDGLLANNCVIGIDTVGGGQFTVTGQTKGVRAVLGASVTVTGAHATSEFGVGVWAEGGSEVTVLGDATATMEDGIGAYAQEGASITVSGDAWGGVCGAASYGADSIVTVGGNAIATNARGVGAAAGEGGEIIIDQGISSSYAYIRIDSTDMDFDDVTLPTTKAGYRTYSGGSPPSTVWVRPQVVCEIVGGAQYETLVDALSDAGDGETVRLLTNISHHSGISIAGETITLDLNGYGLGIIEDSGTGLSVSSGGILLTGSGSFNVTGYQYGVSASSGVATVTSASATSDVGGAAIFAAGGGHVTVTGDVWSDYEGIIASGAGTEVAVGGDVTVEANETWGIQASSSAEGGATVGVEGNVTVNGGGGVLVQGEGSLVHVGGTVTATDGGGAKATNGGHATVDGNVQASAEGAAAWGTGSKVTVGANLSGTTGVTALSGGEVEVRGGVGAVMLGAQAGYDGSKVVIHGGVIVNDEAGLGAEAFGSESSTAEVRIDGAITANTYVKVGGEIKDDSEASRTIPTLLDGYHTYSVDGDIVFVKVPEVEGYPPAVTTDTVTDITASDATVVGSVTDDGGIQVTERGFVYSLAPAPEIGVDGVTRVTAGDGTGSFSKRITGLMSDTIYHVRAYASNEAGTSYGQDRAFRTLPVTPTSDPDEDFAPLIPPAGETGWLYAPAADLSSGNVVLYTDPSGKEHIVGLSIVEGSAMKYVSRGQGEYEIIYNARPFDDISGHWAKSDIDFSTARLLFVGVAPRLFSPDTAMTRGMFAAVLGRMYGVDPSLYVGHSFDDVPESAYYAPHVKWARENGILFGVSESSFEPERPVTRQEMAAMMHRFMKFLGLRLEMGGEEFSDADAIDSWARESVMSLRETGILNGKSGNLFDPDAASTRAEITTVLRRLIEYIVNK